MGRERSRARSRCHGGYIAFAPRAYSGLKLQLESDKGITLNVAAVSAWADRSGLGNNASQGTGAQQIPYTASTADGRPAVGPSPNSTGNDNLAVATNAGLAPTAALTVAMRVAVPATINGGTEPTLCGDFTPTARWTLQCLSPGDTLRVLLGAASATCPSLLVGANLGVWRHIAFVYDGAGADNAARLKIYVDGVAVTPSYSGTVPASMSAGTNALQIGNYDASLRQWPGYIDHVLLYNVALTAAQIAKLATWRPR